MAEYGKFRIMMISSCKTRSYLLQLLVSMYWHLIFCPNPFPPLPLFICGQNVKNLHNTFYIYMCITISL